MGGAKFVVYGGQRWRELEQASGRVAGWGDVSFVCARRGRLELVPRAAVLRALRALAAAGARSARHRGAARDGPRLSQIRYPATGRQWQRRERRQWEGCSAAHHVHSCCQQRALQCSTDANFNSLLKPATITVGVQCSAQGAAARATLTLADADDLMQQSPAGLPQRNRDHEQEFRNKDNGSEEFRNRNHGHEELRSGDQGRGRLRSKGHGSGGLGRRTLISSKKKRQSTSSDSSASVMAAEAPRKRNLPTKTRLAREAVNTKVVQVRRNVSQEVFTSDSDFEPQRQKIVQRNKALTGKAIETKVRRKHSPESASSDGDVESRRKKKLHRSKGHGSKGSRNKDGGSEGSCEQTQNTACKELLISEETVMLLRRFIENDDSNVFGVDLALYDTDDAYKAQFFYRLNPIVDLQRCPQISRMLRDRASRADSVSLEDFVANLGLRSVTEPGAGQTRYRMRARRKSDVTDVRTRSHSDSELDKENSTRAAPRGKRDDTQEQVDRVLEENKRNKLHNHRSKSHSNSKTEARDSSKDLQEVVDVTNYQERSKKPKELDGTSNKGRKDLKGVGDVTDNKGRKDLKGVDVTDNKGRKDLKRVGDVTDNKGRKDLKGVDVTDNKGRKDLKGVGDVTDNKGRKDLKGVGDVTDNKRRKDLKGVGDVSKKKEGRNDLKDVGDVSNKKEGKKELKEVDGTNNKERKELKAVGDVSNKKEGRKEQKEVGGRNSNKEEGGKKKKDVLAKGRGGGMREYSAEEDAHIVRWVRGAGRAHLVNGNRLWAQLQPLHQADTGCFRSWQSLRNRYLRYLLPALAVRQLLPAHEAARLRAAAATGEMKARKLPARRNSAFHQPPVRSAWGRLPRPKPQETLMISDAEEEASQTRSLRSANATNTHARAADRSPPTDTLTRAADRSPPTDTLTRAAERSSPTYSELTKRFALRHRSTPNSDSTDTSSGPSDSTTSTDRRRAASASPTPTRPSPQRQRSTRQRDTSVRSVDTDSDSREVGKADRRRGEQTERNVTKKRVRSKSLGSDTDSERRRASSSDTSGRQIDSGRQLADEKESNKRRRTRSQDSDTDSHRPNKRLRSYSSGRHNGTRADKSDRHRDESAQRADTNKQSGVKSDSLRLNGKVTEPRQRLNADQSLIKNRRQSGKRGRRSDKHVRNDQDSDKSDGQTENSFRRADKSRSAQDIDKTDRQNGSTRDGVKNDPPRDKGEVTKKRRLNADLLGGSHRQSQGDPPSDTSDRHGDRSSQRERDKGERAPRTRRLYNHNAM